MRVVGTGQTAWFWSSRRDVRDNASHWKSEDAVIQARDLEDGGIGQKKEQLQVRSGKLGEGQELAVFPDQPDRTLTL